MLAVQKSVLIAFFSCIPLSFISADEAPSGTKKFDRNIEADNIYICSDIKTVTVRRVSDFYREKIRLKPPNIFETFENIRISSKDKENVLLVVSSDEISPKLKGCISSFDFNSFSLIEALEYNANSLGKPPQVPEGVDLPDYIGITKAGWKYFYEGDWTVMILSSIEGEAYATKHAMTKLFGFDISACDGVAACEVNIK